MQITPANRLCTEGLSAWNLAALRVRHSYRVLRQDLPKLSLIRDRYVHTHFVTMQQSGTHWLSHMLCTAIAEVYDVPEPVDLSDRSVVGHYKRPAVHPQLPRLIQSHNIPSPFCHAWPLRRLLTFPRYVVLLRDMRSSLVSRYEKLYRQTYSFSDYLRNARIIDNPIRWDLWHRIRFLNAWNREQQRLPQKQLLVMRYEQLQADPVEELQRLWAFLGFSRVDEAVFHRAATSSTKERMSRKVTSTIQQKAVRNSSRHPHEWFSRDDRAYLEAVCSSFLHNNFGYDYHKWSA